jgi:hypothetical protein
LKINEKIIKKIEENEEEEEEEEEEEDKFIDDNSNTDFFKPKPYQFHESIQNSQDFLNSDDQPIKKKVKKVQSDEEEKTNEDEEILDR